MTLRHEPDVSHAEWLTTPATDDDARARSLLGPAGLQAYVVVRFDDETSEAPRADADLVADVTRLAAGHTTTPDRAFFALWDGWGELDGGRTFDVMGADATFGRFFTPAAPHAAPPAFDPEVLDAARISVSPGRDHLLFTGPVADVGDWGARPLAPGWPNQLPQAAHAWPADHAWCVSADVEASFLVVAGSRALADVVLARPDLRAEEVSYGSPVDE